MPIEMRRKNMACPECKNPTIFDVGKGYFCTGCMNDIDKSTMTVLHPIQGTTSDAFIQPAKTPVEDVIIDPQVMVDTNVSTVAM